MCAAVCGGVQRCTHTATDPYISPNYVTVQEAGFRRVLAGFCTVTRPIDSFHSLSHLLS